MTAQFLKADIFIVNVRSFTGLICIVKNNTAEDKKNICTTLESGPVTKIKMIYCCFLIWCVTVFVSGEIPSCRDTQNGRICEAESSQFNPHRIRLANNGSLLVVGTSNFLHSFTTDTLDLAKTVDLAPSESEVERCVMEQSIDRHCVNSITLIQQIPQLDTVNATVKAIYDNTVLVCGTNAFVPRCTVHNLSNLSEWFYLNQNPDTDTDLGFSPYSTEWLNIGALSSTGAFYSVTNFAVHSRLIRVAVSLNPLSLRDTSFAVASIDRDPFWVSETEFVSLHELDDHIYIFGREDSNELQDAPEVKFGRVIRICKSDQGIEGDSEVPPRFQTFQKIRIACPNVRDSTLPKFYYNNLQATYLHVGNDGSQWLYASFIAQPNGPSGSAICKYSFSPNEANSLTKLFSETASYYRSDGTYESIQSYEPFVCPGGSGRDRSKEESTSYQLLEGSVLPSAEKAVYTVNGQSYMYIAVDMYEYNASIYEVIYVVTQSMSVEAVCHKDEQLFLQHTLVQYTESISNLLLDKSDVNEGIRKLYIAGESFIASIVLGECHKYSSCKECLESNDPYCAWYNISQVCINKLVSNYSTDVFETSEANINICPSTSSNTINTSTITTTSTDNQSSKHSNSTIIVSTEALCTSSTRISVVSRISVVTEYVTSTVLPPIVNLTTEPTVEPVATQASSISPQEIGEIIGVGIGGLILGLFIGTLLCFASVRLRSKVNHKPLANNGQYPVSDLEPRVNGITRQHSTVEQYTITVTLPEKNNDDFVQSPIPPSISPPIVDDMSELEDDAISDLPPSGPLSRTNSGHGRIKKWAIPKGRTPSTRWLRASESSNAGSESPVSPL